MIRRSKFLPLEMTATQISYPPSCPRRVRPNIIPRRSVCRQLFGPVNHEQLRADLLRERKKMCDENTETWNFDFENGVPLVGRYVWERICGNLTRERPSSSLPDLVNETGTSERLAYFSSPSTELTTATTTTTSSGTAKRQVSNDCCSTQAENNSVDTEKRIKHFRKAKSSGKITDFLRSTKQRTSEKRLRRSRRNTKPKQTSIDLFVRKH